MDKRTKTGTLYIDSSHVRGDVYVNSINDRQNPDPEFPEIKKINPPQIVRPKAKKSKPKVSIVKPAELKVASKISSRESAKEFNNSSKNNKKESRKIIKKEEVITVKIEKPRKLIGKRKPKNQVLDISPEFFKKRTMIFERAKKYSYFGKMLAVVGLTFLLIAYSPSAFYWITSKAGIQTNTKLIGDTFIDVNAEEILSYKPPYQPAFDASLPSENRLKISSIKIDTPIYEASDENYEDALKKGVWREAKFGTPSDRKKPTILAAHRYGYLSWSVSYRLKNSFFNLPKVKIGDKVEIVWRQRKYVYVIYAEETGENASEKTADLILYTCLDLTSPVRVFKYGRLEEL